MKANWVKELIRFGVVGVIATGLHYGIYYLLLQYINIQIAYATGYVAAFIVNFYLTAYFTFKTVPSWKRLAGMGGAHLANYAVHSALFNLFLYMGIPEKYAPFPVFAIAIPLNFILVRFVFKHKKL